MAATVIIEGANFTGKSTLIKELKDEYPVYRGLASLPKETIKKHELSDVMSSDFYAADFIRQVKGNYILERSILSGLIYHNIPIQFFHEQVRLLPNTLTVILWAPDETLRERMDTPEAAERMVERNIDPEDVLIFNWKYLNAYQRLIPDGTLLVDTSMENWLESTLWHIDKHMEKYND